MAKADAAYLAEFELRFVDEAGIEQHSALSRCWHLRFEAAQPVRSFPSYKGQRSFSGEWWFSTTGKYVGHESWLERDNLMLLDYDPDVVGAASQPFWLYWDAGAGVRRHAPDFFVRYSDGSAGVVDVRANDRIKPEDAEAFAAMESACSEVGWRFRRVGALRPAFCRNLRWLSRYAHPRCMGRAGMAARLQELFAVPTPLFEGAGLAGDRLEVLPTLYHLMWRQVLTADLEDDPMNSYTLVRPGRLWSS